MDITVITDIPSPYQVEYFDEIARGIDLFRVVYMRRKDPSRSWAVPSLRHHHLYLGDESFPLASEWVLGNQLAVFSGYGNSLGDQLVKARLNSGAPWCFWGERPGEKHSGLVGQLYRRYKIRTLHASQAPIWGIGGWAVKGYVKEFGRQRLYHNIPYFSDLRRFSNQGERHVAAGDRRVFLYSGSLISRKGVDLLARAFLRLRKEGVNCELRILGEGPLREDLEDRLASLSESVCFLGFKDWSELPTVYAEADILCVPSRYDGWAVVVPEGLAAGLPVISTDRTGATLDLVRPGINGWIVQAGSVDSLHAAMSEAATMPESAFERMQKSARLTASQHSLERGAKRFIEAARKSIENWR